MAKRHELILIILTMIDYGSVSALNNQNRNGRPICTEPKVVNWGTFSKPDFRIVMNCTLPTGVERRPTCKYYLIRISEDPKDRSEIEQVTTNTRLSESRFENGTYNGFCEMFIRVSALTQGSHSFYCRFPADDREYDSYVSNNVIKLKKPRIKLTDCPKGDYLKNGYIRGYTSGSCKCELVEKGNPPAFVQWQDTTSNEYIGSPSVQSAILDVSYDEMKSVPTYKCRGLSSENLEVQLPFKPNFAYGPTYIILPQKNMKHRILNICTVRTITLVCVVHLTWFYPDVVVVVEGFGNKTITPTNMKLIDQFKWFTFDLVLTKGGRFTPTCVGYNSVFPDIRTEEVTHLEVQEPPSATPILSINDGRPIPNGDRLNLSAGHSLSVICQVKGGYPLVPYTTLVISTETSRSTRNSKQHSSNVLNVTKDMDQGVVECSAPHITGCYDKKTQFTFNVQWGAEITMFTVNNFTDLFGKQNSEIDINSYLELKCSALGKPIPYTMSIKNRLGQVVHQRLSLFGNSLVASYRKKVSCKDTGWYTCTASNGVDSPASEDVLILVKCPLELGHDDGHDDDNKRIFKTADDSRANVEFNILGFPKPIRHYLYKIETQSNEHKERRKKYIDMQAGRYNITFLDIDEFSRKLELTMYNMVDNGVTGQYGLEISNGIGEDLDITFQIVIDNGISDGVPSAQIIGVVCGVTLLTIIIVIIVILVRKYIKKNTNFTISPETTSPSTNDMNLGEKNNIPESTPTDLYEGEPDSHVYEEVDKKRPNDDPTTPDLLPICRHRLKTSTRESGYVDLVDVHEHELPIDHLQKKSNIPPGSTYEYENVPSSDPLN